MARPIPRRLCAALALGCVTACTTPDASWRELRSGVEQSLRGVCAVDARTAWVSGAGGTVLRTVDAGATWESLSVPGAEQVDFRDVHADGADRAWIMVAGTPARIYATMDGGVTWQVQLDDPDPDAFHDAFAFWEPRAALLYGDQQDDAFTVRTTADGGAHWRRVPAAALPAARPGENGFAASGTCVAVWGEAHGWIGTGGGAARVLRTDDRGATWSVAETPLLQGKASQGLFSLAFRARRHGVAVGGDYEQPELAQGNAAWSDDGGLTWQACAVPPRGYRSAVAFVPGALHPTCVAVGPSGSDYSVDGGKNWRPLGDAGFHALAVSPDGSVAWCVGAEGRVARLEHVNLLAKRSPPR